ncbi:hypothetical protein O181_046287 [Austropuccinia psidii MF-1]|uniref:Uncharacterized protein n=1 Tax=Austropuccinia psidii MF-1 TaxID=1389203 RepID=A0A9Q3DQY9_9BASI|nr:hypothetical protein [Austropuccinia psidii MF-1]
MPVQHPPSARQTRSQARHQAALTPKPRAPKLRASLSECGEEKEENFVEEKEYEATEGLCYPVMATESTGGQNIAKSNKPDTAL